MKALTLWPEWAFAICRMGKNVENRTWKPSLKNGELYAIHAGAHYGGSKGSDISTAFDMVDQMATRAGMRIAYERYGSSVRMQDGNQNSHREYIEKIPKGAIVAVVRHASILAPGWYDENTYPWWADIMYGWQFDRISILEYPIPCRGSQRLWTVPSDVLDKVMPQVEYQGWEELQ